jgi:uncharacterized tellurite resistance protein B-like protein
LKTTVEHFRNLVSLSIADGKIAEVERVALSQIAYERGIPMDRLNVMLNKAHEYRFVIPQNLTEREKQLAEMIEFASVDGEFSPAEMELITHVADRLGFSRLELDKMLKAHGHP